MAEQPVQEVETEKNLMGKTVVKDPEQLEVQTKQLKAYKRQLEGKEIELEKANKKISSLRERAEQAESRAEKAEKTLADICTAFFYRQLDVLRDTIIKENLSQFCPFITKSLCITYKVNLIISLWKRLQIFFIIVLDKLEFDGGKEMFEELGISFGTALIVLIALYFVVKWAVKNGIKEAYKDITVKDTAEDIEAEEICNELGLNEEEK